MKKLTFFIISAIILCISAVWLINNGLNTAPNEPKSVVIELNNQNQLFVDGTELHFSRLQDTVDMLRSENESKLEFHLVTDSGSCINRINDLTRIIHPDDVVFASNR
ncbi:MAG: hypothetical protein LAT67_09490 [Balneolales bacterium]|nr:hypothetical protein [Balneolales bacterium]